MHSSLFFSACINFVTIFDTLSHLSDRWKEIVWQVGLPENSASLIVTELALFTLSVYFQSLPEEYFDLKESLDAEQYRTVEKSPSSSEKQETWKILTKFSRETVSLFSY